MGDDRFTSVVGISWSWVGIWESVGEWALYWEEEGEDCDEGEGFHCGWLIGSERGRLMVWL